MSTTPHGRYILQPSLWKVIRELNNSTYDEEHLRHLIYLFYNYTGAEVEQLSNSVYLHHPTRIKVEGRFVVWESADSSNNDEGCQQEKNKR